MFKQIKGIKTMINAIKSILGMNKPIQHQFEVESFLNKLSSYKYYNQGSK